MSEETICLIMKYIIVILISVIYVLYREIKDLNEAERLGMKKKKINKSEITMLKRIDKTSHYILSMYKEIDYIKKCLTRIINENK